MPKSREQIVDLYTRMVSTHPGAVLKGATMPYTSLNGHMYSFLSKQDVVALRLPEPERSKFIVKYKTKLMESYGIVQKEYVVVPDDLLKKTSGIKKYFAISYQNVKGMKPKATTRKKK